MPCTYSEVAYGEVMTWTAETLIQYAPNKKRGKSFDRYGKYMQAKTVEEALELGSIGLDLLFDFEKGLVWSVGGPKREKPPDSEEVRQAEAPTLADRTLSKMYHKWQVWKATFKLLDDHGVDRRELKKLNQEQTGATGEDSLIIQVGRREAQEKAKEILSAVEAEGRKVTDDDMLSVLRLWGFKENSNRGNVMPEGQSFVHSDTIGLIKMSTCDRMLVTLGTKRYPEVTVLFARWLKDNRPSDLPVDFPFTSININKNYAAKVHRDGNNYGPSMIKAFGKFEGGELNYWPADSKKGDVENLAPADKTTLSIKDNLLMFDGNRAHSVNDFSGERYSLVFFSLGAWRKAPAEDVQELRGLGVPFPTEETSTQTRSLLDPAGGRTFRAWGPSQQGGGPPPTCGARAATVAGQAATPGQKRKAQETTTPVKSARSTLPGVAVWAKAGAGACEIIVD